MNEWKRLLSESDQEFLSPAALERFAVLSELAAEALSLAEDLRAKAPAWIEAALDAVRRDWGHLALREPRVWSRLAAELDDLLRASLAGWALGSNLEDPALEWLDSRHEAYEQPPEVLPFALAQLTLQLEGRLAEVLSPRLERVAAGSRAAGVTS